MPDNLAIHKPGHARLEQTAGTRTATAVTRWSACVGPAWVGWTETGAGRAGGGRARRGRRPGPVGGPSGRRGRRRRRREWETGSLGHLGSSEVGLAGGPGLTDLGGRIVRQREAGRRRRRES